MSSILSEPGWRIAFYYLVMALICITSLVQLIRNVARQKRERFESDVTHARAAMANRDSDDDDPVDVLLPGAASLIGLRSVAAAVCWAALTLISLTWSARAFSTAAYVHRANRLYDEHAYDEAIVAYKAALASDPRASELHQRFESALAEADANGGDLMNVRRYTQMHPGDIKAHSALSDALLAKHDMGGAIEEASIAVNLRPLDATLHNNLGNMLAAAGQHDRAVQELRRAIELNASVPEAHYNLGNELVMTNDIAGAIEEFKRAIELNPRLSAAYCNLAHVTYLTGDRDRAIFLLDQYIRMTHGQPANAKPHDIAVQDLASWKLQ